MRSQRAPYYVPEVLEARTDVVSTPHQLQHAPRPSQQQPQQERYMHAYPQPQQVSVQPYMTNPDTDQPEPHPAHYNHYEHQQQQQQQQQQDDSQMHWQYDDMQHQQSAGSHSLLSASHWGPTAMAPSSPQQWQGGDDQRIELSVPSAPAWCAAAAMTDATD